MKMKKIFSAIVAGTIAMSTLAAISAFITGVDVETKAGTKLEPNKLYAQKTEVVDGKYAERFVMMISEEDAAKYSAVNFEISNGTKTAKIVSNNYYTTISAAGEKLTADKGYVFVACAIKNVPEAINLTPTLTFTEV